MSKLTPEGFEALLLSLHPANREAAGVIYQHLRQSLIRYFERRKCSRADELADATLDRVGLKAMTTSLPVLAKQPGAYCMRVARFIYLEHVKHEALKPKSLPAAESDPDGERRLECLEQCVAQLPNKDQQFFAQYHRASADERFAMAQAETKSLNALRVRAHKILGRLEDCCRQCLEQSLKLTRK